MNVPLPLPAQKELKVLFNYDPLTGRLTRKTSAGGFQIGSPVGCKKSTGYLDVGINRTYYKAHRLIWMWMTGQDPGPLDIDHKNLNPADNRWSNLRLSTRSANKYNNGGYRSNTSGVKGVSWDPRRALWVVYRRHNGKNKFLGRFSSIEEAAAASRAWDAH